MTFEISTELIEKIKLLVQEQNNAELLLHFEDLHFADIAEILDEISLEEATYIVKLLDSEKTSEALMELEEDVRERILNKLSAKEIAEELEEMDTDDAADIISELSEERAQQVISEMEDEEHAENIVELLRYDEDSAGGLMAKELVRVYEDWTVTGCVAEMRKQAENVTRVHSIYVVDAKEKLKGRLSLKDLLTAKRNAHISDIFIPQVDFVTVHTKGEEVARVMQKYDLEAIPVVDEMNRLVGRVTIDDIVDFIKEEAEKDYQMAAGISQDVEADDNVWQLTRARLPWLVLGLFGGLGSVYIMKGFDEALAGVQSSAIIVQGLANDNIKGSLLNRLFKEVGLSLINGTALGLLVMLFGFVVGQEQMVSITVAVSMLSVIIVAALIGTFVPIILDKQGIDPAIATGPFITTSNDIFGIFLFFYLAKLILGF